MSPPTERHVIPENAESVALEQEIEKFVAKLRRHPAVSPEAYEQTQEQLRRLIARRRKVQHNADRK